jgi:hypothetical protein
MVPGASDGVNEDIELADSSRGVSRSEFPGAGCRDTASGDCFRSKPGRGSGVFGDERLLVSTSRLMTSDIDSIIVPVGEHLVESVGQAL